MFRTFRFLGSIVLTSLFLLFYVTREFYRFLSPVQTDATLLANNSQHCWMLHVAGLQITTGQRTMSGLIADLTGQTPVLPVILTGHFWIQTLYFPDSCRLMLYNAAMISFFFGLFCCFALNPSKKKNAAIN